MALELYKPDEATRSRGGIGILLAALLGYGVFSLYEFLAVGFWQKDMADGLLGDEFPLSPRVMVCLVLLAVVGFGIYILCNHQRIVDFLIATEQEMEKVSWSPKHEVVSSSIVVVVTVIVLALYLGGVDYLITLFTQKIPWRTILDPIFGGGA